MTLAIDIQTTENNWRKKVSSRFGDLPTKWLTGSKTYDPASLADGDWTSTDVTVAGAVLGNYAVASFSLDTQGIMLTADVKAADTVTVKLLNKTGGTLDLGSGTLRAAVLQA